MTRRLAHFSDPRLDAQVEELIKHGNATREAADGHAARRDNPHKVTPEQIGAETPAGAQAKVDSHATAAQTHGASGSYRLAKTSRTDQLPAWADIPDKPATFRPSAHKSTHASGGSDALTPADIGAVSKAGDTMTGPLNFNDSNKQIRSAGNNIQLMTFTADAQLSGLTTAQIMANCYSDGTEFRRIDTALPVQLLQVSRNNIQLYVAPAGNNPITWIDAYTVWHAGNDGTGSGSDMDMLDGYHASYFQPASDERLKADIQPFADALAKVLSLRGVSFVWNDKAQEIGANRETLAGREIGLLAGEVAQVVPEVVLDWVETPDGKYKTVDSARLVALLVEAIKDLNAKVEHLQAQVAALEGGAP